MLKYAALAIASFFMLSPVQAAAPAAKAPVSVEQSVTKNECRTVVRSHYRRGSMTKRGWRSGTTVRRHYRR